MNNKLQEQWERWEPLQNLSEAHNIVSLSNYSQTFDILLNDIKNPHKKLKIIFESYVASYRRTSLSIKNIPTDSIGWTFFKINNSSYLASLVEESSGISQSFSLTHFLIIGKNSVVEIIAAYDPTLQIIEREM